MSFLSLVKAKFGLNPTATDNFVIESTGAGTGRIRKGDFSTVGSDVLTWDANNAVWGGRVLGYAQVTASQSGVTTEVDATGLSVTVNVLAGQRIKITGYFPSGNSSVASDTLGLRVYEGASMLQDAESLANTVMNAMVVLSPSGGSHTYKLRVARLIGTGNATFYAAATYPAFILVEAL